MREADAVYGGEMSAHHYFRDFAYCDSGMIPWLLVHAAACASAASRCPSWWASASRRFPRAARSTARVADAKATIAQRARAQYGPMRAPIDLTDGLSASSSSSGASTCARRTPSR